MLNNKSITCQTLELSIKWPPFEPFFQVIYKVTKFYKTQD
jgi:hypothetical protein